MIFIRPWLLLLLLVPLLLRQAHKRLQPDNPWRGLISPKLLPYLLVQYGTIQPKKFFWTAFIIWSLLSVAAAGPAFEKIQVPGITRIPGTVLVVDLNSMNPEKLPQLKMKLFELLKGLDTEEVGLVLYDQKGYVVVPLTQDLQIIQGIIPTLSPYVLPAVGNRPEKGFEKAIQLLENTHQKSGRIIFITGGGVDTKKTLELIRKTPYNIGILGIGDDKTGAPVLSPNGHFLRDANGNLQLAKLDEASLSQLGTYVQTTPDGSDVVQLLNKTQMNMDNTFLPDKKQNSLFKADEWQDLGIYLVLMSVPFIALLFRRGVFFILILCFISFQAVADPWIRSDQADYRLIEKGVQFYRQKNYKEALKRFEQVQTPDAYYNKGNALAQLGELKEAIQAYNKVLEEQPKHREAAFNKAYLEKLLEASQKKQPQESTSNQMSPFSDSSENQSEQTHKKESEQQKGKSSQSQTDSENSNQAASSSQKTDSSNEKEVSEKFLSKSDSQTDYGKSQNKENGSISSEPHNDLEKKQRNESSSQQDQSTLNSNEDHLNQTQRDQQKQIEEEELEQVYPIAEPQGNADMTSSEDKDKNSLSPDSQEQDSQPKEKSLKVNSQIFQEENFSDNFDQETQELFNRLKRDPSRILRYRLHEQNRRESL